jgi:deoxyribodipyrimidine photolyase-related protein
VAGSPFATALADRQSDPANRVWLYVPYDQLTDQIGALAKEDPATLGIVLVESTAKATLRPYHKQKLALILANMRQFALEQAERGVAVRHIVTADSYAQALAPIAQQLGPLRCMVPAERELRVDLKPLARSGAIEWIPHDGWLTTRAQFDASHPRGAPWRMDRFYRRVRQDSGILMEDGSPAGGKYSFDADNRRAWQGEPAAPVPPVLCPDPVTEEVLALVATRFADHPGQLDGESLPATKADAERLWQWARAECLRDFGPFQDAMSAESSSLFHTRISALLHLHRLLPVDVLADVLEMDLPLASTEGFVRQVLGWREFVHHVHDATDGLRKLPNATAQAEPNYLDMHGALPPAFWGTQSGLSCLDRVVADVWREGYGHHITRLMVLSNIATLLDVSPRELTDWFWVAYTDAFDWVVEPNVLGMGTFAVGDLMTTKPYIAGAAYIDRMGDYCPSCAFNPKKDCPIRSLYWAFLERHRAKLQGNHRLAVPLASAAKRSQDQQLADRSVFERVGRDLRAGRTVQPGDE